MIEIQFRNEILQDFGPYRIILIESYHIDNVGQMKIATFHSKLPRKLHAGHIVGAIV